jgi:hypothetical protein
VNSVASQRHNQERRRYSRVVFDRSGRLTDHDRRQRYDQVCNLSIGGACLQGPNSLRPGDICNFELHEDGRYSCRIVKFCVRVIWIGSNKLALEFVNMDVDNYMFLQTLVLYNTDDPLGVSNKFHDNFSNPFITATY